MRLDLLRINLFLFLFFIFTSVVVVADIQLDHREDVSGNYASNNLESFLAVDSVSVQDGIIPPVIYDVDGDGYDEMILADGSYIELWNWNKSSQDFDWVDSYDHGATLLTKFFVSDYSGTPTIFFVTNDMWHTLRYNGTDFLHYNTSQNFYELEGGFGCGEINDNFYCFLYDPYSSGVASEMRLHRLNATDPTSLSVATITVDSTGCTPGRRYHVANRPELRGVLIHNDDAYFTWWPDCSGGFGIDTRMSKIEGDTWSPTTIKIDDSDCTCENNVVTTPLDVQNGPGILVACETSSVNYDICKYSESLSFQDSYPGPLNDVEGNILSNLFRMDCFQDTGADDVGIIGYRASDDSLNLLCVNDVPGIADTDREFDPLIFGNVSDINSTETWTANMQDGTGKDALFTRFGILSTVSTRNTLVGSEGEVGSAFSWTHSVDGITMPASFNGDPSDVIVISRTNLYYYDDNYVNTEPDITQACVDPANKICTDETVTVSFTITDPDGDRVSAYLFAYDGLPYEQNYSVLNMPSGQTNYISFPANVSLLNAPLTLVVTDNSSESTGNTSYTYYMQVSNSSDCQHAGDSNSCFTSVSTADAEADENLSTEPSSDRDDAVSNLVRYVNGSTGLGTTLIWLLIMGAVAYSLWRGSTHSSDGESKRTFGIICFVEFILLMVGIKLQFINAAYLMIIGLVAAAILTIAGKAFTKGGG